MFWSFVPPLAPKNLLLRESSKYAERKFSKSMFLGGPEGLFGFEPSKMSLYMIIYFLEGRRPKNATFKKKFTSGKCHY